MASSNPPSNKSILFVCLGNICRSPIAEAVFRHLIQKRGGSSSSLWTVDSCGTIDYHHGKNPDPRASKVLLDRGVTYQHKARVIRKEDFAQFTYIMAMDKHNVQDLMEMKPPSSNAKIHRLGEFDKSTSKVEDVADPYYDNDDKGFYVCYDQCLKACEGFLDSLEE